jgi:hypothetical protein
MHSGYFEIPDYLRSSVDSRKVFINHSIVRRLSYPKSSLASTSTIFSTISEALTPAPEVLNC